MLVSLALDLSWPYKGSCGIVNGSDPNRPAQRQQALATATCILPASPRSPRAADGNVEVPSERPTAGPATGALD